ncbi:hypothetical protein [Atlantibacter sp.]|uniref:hypothetical protein n=1 Tax=Atlantibacter sp. TaxID=1903473 RepID=UPI0028A29A8B|nr:hypothetical protein [Atlantibacter sp.]
MHTALYSELLMVLLIITRLAQLRRIHMHKPALVRLVYWLALVSCAILLVRLMDGRITATFHHVQCLLLIAALIWQGTIIKFFK